MKVGDQVVDHLESITGCNIETAPSFSRFDLAALGDVTNIRKDAAPPRGRTMVAGLLFELSPGVTPFERTPPYDRVSGGGGEAVYFKARQSERPEEKKK